MIDVHCHLDFFNDAQIKNIIAKCKQAGVNVVVSNGTDHKTNLKNLDIAAKYREVRVALGAYPTEILKMSDKEIEDEIKFIRTNAQNIVAVGEIGIDYKECEEREKQKKVFETLIILAREIGKPVIVHSRKAEEECIKILEKSKSEKVIMHCFSGKIKLAERIYANKWFLSIPANVKFSSHFQEVVKKIPLDGLLCETDSPFLHPDKQKDNTPFNVVESYKKIAEIKNLNLNEVEQVIEKNFLKVFYS